MNRDKSKWNKNAIFADLLYRFGKKLANTKMWEQYIMLSDTVGPGCELAEKACNLLFSDEEIKNYVEELDELYARYEKLTKN